jgi:hypothetical protein
MSFKKIGLVLLGVFFLAACSGENGMDGRDGESVNVDSLAAVLRGELSQDLWDSMHSETVLDSVYDKLFNDAFTDAWLDSTREALLDSLLYVSYDSLYNVLYDSVYNDIYEKSVAKDLFSYINFKKENFNTAFANQYSLMYNGFEHPVPLGVKIENSGNLWHSVIVKAWIPDYSDTGIVSGIVNPNKSNVFAPEIKLIPEKYLHLKAAASVLVQVRAFALENNREILVFSESYNAEIYPVDLRGPEYVGIDTSPWWNVWVTPNMDSITSIHSELASLMPSGYGGYQLYGFNTMEESVNNQVQKVYEVLQKKGITYVSNTNAGAVGQKIKYPIQVLRTKQANCIEGAFLFASILESIGLDVVLVSIPGHAFVGWKTEEEGDTYNFLETTLAWNETPVSFSTAVNKAIKSYNKEVTNGNFESGESRIISVTDARDNGVNPNDIP